MEDACKRKKLDLVTVTETWCNARTKVYMEDYNIIRKDRQHGDGERKERGGGVMLMIRNGLKYKHEPIDGPEEVECITINRTRFIVVYSTPPGNVGETLTAIEANMDDNTIILGDFNARHPEIDGGSVENGRGREIAEWMEQVELISLNKTYQPGVTTRVAANGSGSPIDLVLVNRDKVDHHRLQVDPEDLESDHRMVIGTTKTERMERTKPSFAWKRVPQNSEEYRTYFLEKREQISNAITAIERSRSDAQAKVNEAWAMVRAHIIYAARAFVGATPRGPRRHFWWNEEIQKLIQRRHRATERETKAAYKTKIRKAIRESKKRCWEAMIEKIHLQETNLMWSTVKKVTGRSKRREKSSLVELDLFAERWQADPTAPDVELQHYLLEERNEDEFTEEEFKRAWKKRKNGRAAGPDEITTEMLKAGGHGLFKICHDLINMIWRSGEFPSDWRDGNIIPLFKKGSKKEAANYRPITLLNTMAKIYEAVILERLNCEVDERKLLDDYQAGFRNGRSTTTNVMIITEVIRERKANKKTTQLAYLDISGAYDSVSRLGLRNVLAEAQVGVRMHKALTSWLKTSTRRVVSTGDKSRDFEVNHGVPQGSVLSPLLFNLYLDKVMKQAGMEGKGVNYPVNECKEMQQIRIAYLAYADDVVLMAESPNDLQRMVTAVNTTMRKWCLHLSPAKCEYQQIGKRGHKEIKIQTNNGDHQFKETDRAKYLGCYISSRKRSAMKERIKQAEVAAWQLNRIRCKGITIAVSKATLLYKSMVRPIMEYGSIAAQTTERELNLMDKVTAQYLKRWMRLPRNTQTSALMYETGLEPAESRIQQLRANFVLRNYVQERKEWLIYKILEFRRRTYTDNDQDPIAKAWKELTEAKLDPDSNEYKGHKERYAALKQHNANKANELVREKMTKLWTLDGLRNHKPKMQREVYLDQPGGKLWLMLRTNNLLTWQMKKRRHVTPYREGKCKCGEEETYQHLIFYCPYWRDELKQTRQRYQRRPKDVDRLIFRTENKEEINNAIEEIRKAWQHRAAKEQETM